MAMFLLQVDFLVNLAAIDNSTGHVLLDNFDLIDKSGQSVTAVTSEVNGTVRVDAPLLQIMTTITVRLEDHLS